VKRVLIFGGNRFVGKQLSEVLIDTYRVDVFNRSGTSSDDRISVIQGDRNNKQDIDKIDFDKYDYIVDMCLFFPSQLKLIMDLVKSKYIFVSSAAANDRYIEYYGDYGKDKLAVEDMLVDSNLDYVIIRPSYIIGKGDHRDRLNYYLKSIQNEIPIKIDGDGQNKINMVFSQDVVNVLHNLIKYWVRNDNRFYYICGNQSVRLVDFINHINKKYYNKNIKFNFNQKDAIFPKNDFILSNKYTCRDLDVSFTDLYKGVDDYLQVT
tara:strand:+ start:1121 stop:1912 length:792 start_codon:yes stop_codon:yes gene_type:complete